MLEMTPGMAGPEAQASVAGADDQQKDGASKRKLGVGGWVATAWLAFMVVIAIVAPMLTASPVEGGSRALRACGSGDGIPLYEPLNCRDRTAVRTQKSDGVAEGDITHLTGVDSAGRDVFSRTVLGTRTTLIIAVVSIAAAVLLGGAMGLVAGYFRGRIDTVISTAFDVMIAFPPLILAMLLVINYAGNEPDRRVPGIMIALTIVATPILGRIARVSTLAWSQREFVTAAKALGAKPFRIIIREVLPNVAPAMMVMLPCAAVVVVIMWFAERTFAG